MRLVSRITHAIGLGELPKLRKLIIGVVGGTIVIIGIALIVLPGPAFIVIPTGLAILASEFAWARRAIRRGKVMLGRVRQGNSSARENVRKSEKMSSFTNVTK